MSPGLRLRLRPPPLLTTKGHPHPALGTTRWFGKNRSRASSALQRPVIGGPFDGDLRWLMVPVERSLLRCPAASRAPSWPGGLLRVSKGGGGRRPTPGDMERKGLPAAAGPPQVTAKSS